MKLINSTAIFYIISINLIGNINAITQCLQTDTVANGNYTAPLDVVYGWSFGMIGNWASSDCSNSTYKFTYQTSILYTMTVGILTGQYNFMSPYYQLFNALIAFNNMETACLFNQQASQFNLRTNTVAGLGELTYLLYNVPVEGFVTGSVSPSTNNQIWSAFYALWQGS